MAQFLASCGAEGPLRLDVTGPNPRQSVRCVFEQPCVLIGREPGNDLRLDHDQVSRRHAYVQVMAGRTFCVDLGSRTGLWWANRTRPAGWLDVPVHVGPYALQLADRPAAGPDAGLDWNPLDTPAADQRILPRVVLEVFDGARSTLHTLHHLLTLAGRSSACRLQIPNVSLSRHHCSFLLTAEGVWVVDLLSREGTAVNGQRVKWACLRPGDRLELGRVVIRPRYEGTAPEGPATSAPALNGDRFHADPASDPELPGFAATEPPAGPAPARSMVSVPLSLQPQPAPAFDLKALEEADPRTALLVPVLQQFNLMQQQMIDQFQQSMQMMVQVFASMHRDQMDVLQRELEDIRRINRELSELQAAAKAAQPAAARNGSPRPAPAPARPAAAPGNAGPSPGAPAKPPPPPPAGTPAVADMHDWLNQRIHTLQKEREGRWQKVLGFVLGK